MPGKRYKPKQVVNLLRKIEVEIANGKNAAQAAREAGITEHTYYRWRKEFGGLKLDQSRAHSGTPLSIFLSPHALGMSAGKGLSSEENGVVDPARHAYSHSASVGSR